MSTTKTLLDLVDERTILERYGMNIKLNLPRNPLYHFRITYRNPGTQNTRDGITISTDNIQEYVSEIVQQLNNAGFFVQELNDQIWTKECFYAYLRSKDVCLEYPRMKVYVHPNEMAGWAPKKELQTFLDIANTNSVLSNVQLLSVDKVYNIDNDHYLQILRDAKDQILAWLSEYSVHHRRNMGNAAQTFNRIFGIKRLQTSHLSFNDHIAIHYIENLIKWNFL